jgi:DNA recombination protein RmuC
MQTLIAGLIAAFVGTLVGFWLRSTSAKTEKFQTEQRNVQRNQELSSELALVRRELAQAQADSVARAGFESLAAERLDTISKRSDELAEANRRLQEKDAELLRLTKESSKFATDLANEQGNGERLVQQIRLLANEILKENSKTFTDQNKESLSHLLNPLSRDLNDFRTRVEEVKAENLVGRTELSAQLKGLESLNKKLSEEAHNLATALRRDTKAQGNWGEIILLDILENSGLRKGEHFTFQESFVEESIDGNPGQRRQTDVVVKLPEGRHLIIDSKVSLNAYNNAVSASAEAERNIAVKSHLASVRRHYTELAGRNYHRLAGVQSPDFVVMFVPIEPAFMLAIQEDDGLWLDAYKKGVLLAGPTTVLFVVRIVENLWRQERQVRNVEEIFDRGRKLYEKFVNFAADLASVGKSLGDAEESYQAAMSKLTTGRENLVRQTEMLKELGIRTNKKLPSKLLDAAGLDAEEQAQLTLAASGDESLESPD